MAVVLSHQVSDDCYRATGNNYTPLLLSGDYEHLWYFFKCFAFANVDNKMFWSWRFVFWKIFYYKFNFFNS